MALKLKNEAGVLKTITSLKLRDGSGMKTIRTLKLMDADGVTLRTVATFVPPMTASPSLSSVSAEGDSSTLDTFPVTVTPSGGSAPYTYAWSIISGTATILSPTNATTQFRKSGLIAGVEAFATAQCDVTDSSAQTASVVVELSFYRNTGGV